MTILQACEKININIPKFCYHDKLSIAGNCRMCLVELEKAPKPIAACAMPLANGMKIFTESPLVKKAREASLELLLINHPLDCPICDQGGECDLQDQSLNYGSDRSRYFEHKRTVEDKKLGPIIKTIMTRCIHCTKCIRFCNEIIGGEFLGTLGRGSHTEIGNYVARFVKSELSGNLVDICPVGALTSKSYAFISRRWELYNFDGVDCFDALGSNINICTRNLNAITKYNKYKKIYAKDEILRILPRINDDINETWISDKSRYGIDGIRLNRLEAPILKVGRDFSPLILTWKNFFLNLKEDKNFLFNYNKNNWSIIGKSLDVESIFYFFNFSKMLKNTNIQTDIFMNININYPSSYKFNTDFTSVEKADLILLLNTNPRTEASMLNLKIRKAQQKKNTIVAGIGSIINIQLDTYHLGNGIKSFFDIVEGKHIFCKIIKRIKNPLIIIGESIFSQKYCINTNIITYLRKKLIYLENNINILYNDTTKITFNELGLKTKAQSLLYNKNVNMLKNWKKLLSIQYDLSTLKKYSSYYKTSIKKFCLNFNTHNDSFISSDTKLYSLPLISHFENNNYIMNTCGYIQKNNKSISIYKESRKLQNILQTFLSFFNNYLLTSNKYLDLVHIFSYKNLIEELPIMIKTTKKYFKVPIQKYYNYKINIYHISFKTTIHNFYMTDIITSNSRSMTSCRLFVNNIRNNFKEIF